MLNKLEKALGYKFRDPELLRMALTHTSCANEIYQDPLRSYERLEFLGDSIVGFVTAEYLYRTFPKKLEGDLTRIRAELVCEKSLAAVAERLSLGEHLPEARRAALSDPPFTPQQPAMLLPGQSLLRAALKRDLFLSYPYESMEPFLQMVREAANAPDVLSIRITIYRLARKAKLVDYLCAAAENGKDVTVLIELRARFDEQNNIDWSERLEEAGCKVLYGFEDYKVHSKICLITLRERGALRHVTQIGTGNYNEKTAKQYTDVSIVTADQNIGAAAAAFFSNMALGNLEGSYGTLLVAPHQLKKPILARIEEQTALGPNGYILMKFNSLTDIDVIHALSRASQAGVRVELIIRGICCLAPGVPGYTDNITVTSIVGRFLEHSRIFCFGRGEQEHVYISSADMMTRNTVRRVEIACPIRSPEIRRRLHEILDAMLADTVKARVLLPDGTYTKKPP